MQNPLTLPFLYEKLKNRSFHVVFLTTKGVEKTMIARTGVKKYLKGGTTPYSATAHNLFSVYSFDREAYRKIKVDNILSIKCGEFQYTKPC